MADIFNNIASGLSGNKQQYVPQYQAGSDQLYNQNINYLNNPANNPYAQTLPDVGNLTHSIVTNPYAGPAMGYAQQSGMDYVRQGKQDLRGANQLYQMGFDPQSSLYNRTLGQVQQQARAGNEARGLDMSGVGAGLENQALGNFNIDWQNNELARALQAAPAAANLGAQGAGMVNQGGNLPYDTLNQILQNNIGALGQYGQYGVDAAQIPQMSIQDILGYLQQGTNATSAQNVGNMNSEAGALGNISGLGNLWGQGAVGAGGPQKPSGIMGAVEKYGPLIASFF